MTFLPIVARELRAAARRRGTHRVRWGSALGLILICGWILFMKQHQPPRVIAMSLFLLLTGGAVIYCLLSGVWLTSDCLSREKREGTLGLLFLTDLKGYDVVLGKLAATSLNALYAVLAVVPVLALPLLLGGVTVGEFARMALVALNTLFFSLTLGICVSAMTRLAHKAMAVAGLLILLFTVLLPAWGLYRTVLMTGARPGGNEVWLLASAGFSYYWALDLPYRGAAEQFWRSVAVIHSLGWVCLLLASAVVPHTWQTRAAGPRASRWRERWRAWTYGGASWRARFRKQLLDRNAYFWLAARLRWRPATVWVALGVVAGVWMWGLAKWGRDWLDEGVYILTGLLLNLLIKAWFALEAGRQPGADRREGALEMLLSTPLTVEDILRGQLLALRRQFQGPVTVVLLAFFLFMLLGAFDPLSQSESVTPGLWVLFSAASMVLLVADLTALYWFGMWRGLTAKTATRAAVENLGCILVLPWVAANIGMVAASLSWPDLTEVQVQTSFLGLWLGLGLAADLGFGLWARHNLLTEFRLAAARTYEPRRGFWKRLLRRS